MKVTYKTISLLLAINVSRNAIKLFIISLFAFNIVSIVLYANDRTPNLANIRIDTISYCSKQFGNFYYRDKNVLSYITRYNITNACALRGVMITLSGDTGHFNVKVYGSEGNMNAPFVSNLLYQSNSVNKKKKGVENIFLPIDDVVINSQQFFIEIDKLNQGMYLLTDTITSKNVCYAKDREIFTNQLLKIFNRIQNKYEYKYSKYNFFIEPIISYYSTNDKRNFVIDSSFQLVSNTSNQGIEAKDNNTSNTDFIKGNNRSIAVGDVNNDGYDDAVNNGVLYINNKGINYKCITQFATKYGIPKVNFFIDINSDGLLDVVFLGTVGKKEDKKNVVFLNIDGKKFKEIQLTLPDIPKPNCYCIADINMDGYPDIAISQKLDDHSNSDNSFLVLINTKQNSFIDYQSNIISETKSEFESCNSIQFVDINSDGLIDISLVGIDKFSSKYKRILLLQHKLLDFYKLELGAKVFSDKVEDCPDYWYDLNNDGYLDYIDTKNITVDLIDKYTQNNAFINLGEGIPEFKHVNFGTIDYSFKVSSTVWGDIDNDGHSDCLIATNCNCYPAEIYLQQMPLVFQRSTLELGLNGLDDINDAILYDSNNDGLLDLLCVHNGMLTLYKNNQRNQNNFISLRFSNDIVSKYHLIKAKVHIGNEQYVRDLSLGRGRLMQDPAALHFGLNNNTSIDSVEIFVNGNERMNITDLKINSQYIIDYDNFKTQKTIPTVTITVKPNPFESNIDICYEGSNIKNLSIEVYDLRGNRVKQFEIANEPKNCIAWDGRDDQGEPIPVGNYSVIMKSGSVIRYLNIIKIGK